MSSAANATIMDGNSTDLGNVNLAKWVNHDMLSGTLLFLMMFMFAWLALTAIGSITVPKYQIQANSEKDKENNREWQNIWGNLEK